MGRKRGKKLEAGEGRGARQYIMDRRCETAEFRREEIGNGDLANWQNSQRRSMMYRRETPV